MNRWAALITGVFGTVLLIVVYFYIRNNDTPVVPSAAPTATSTTTAGIGISKIRALRDQFPPGFSITIKPKIELPSKNDKSSPPDWFRRELAKRETVDPPQCQQASAPLQSGTVGTMEEIVGSKKTTTAHPGGTINVALFEAAAPRPEFTIPAECSKITIDDPGVIHGTTELIDAPAIAGVKTFGTSTSIELTTEVHTKFVMTSYIASSDSTHLVVATSIGDVDKDVLRDLFVEAVNITRHQ